MYLYLFYFDGVVDEGPTRTSDGVVDEGPTRISDGVVDEGPTRTSDGVVDEGPTRTSNCGPPARQSPVSNGVLSAAEAAERLYARYVRGKRAQGANF